MISHGLIFFTVAAYAINFNNSLTDIEKMSPKIQEASRSVAMIVTVEGTSTDSEGNVHLRTDESNYCPGHPFKGQLHYLDHQCSAFLIAPDIMMTSGHCRDECKNMRFVFGVKKGVEKLPASNVYDCEEIIKSNNASYDDFAIIRLKRAVTGREPLRYRQSGKVSNNVVSLGHPDMLSLKGSQGIAFDIEGNELGGGRTTASEIGGMSGGPIVNKDGMVEGINNTGTAPYYDPKKKCVQWVAKKTKAMGITDMLANKDGMFSGTNGFTPMQNIAPKIPAGLVPPAAAFKPAAGK